MKVCYVKGENGKIWFFLFFFFLQCGRNASENFDEGVSLGLTEGPFSHFFSIMSASYGKKYIKEYAPFTKNKKLYAQKYQIPIKIQEIPNSKEAKKYGFPYPKYHPCWLKLFFLKRELEYQMQIPEDRKVPFLGWVDTDAIFMFYDPQPIDHLLSNVDPETTLVIGPDISLVGVNTGIFFVRNNEEGLNFVEKWIQSATPEKKRRLFHEQDILQSLMEQDGAVARAVKLSPPALFNAFPEKPHHPKEPMLYKAPGLVLHFAGVNRKLAFEQIDQDYRYEFGGTEDEFWAWRSVSK